MNRIMIFFYAYLTGGTASGSAATGVKIGEICRFLSRRLALSVDLFQNDRKKELEMYCISFGIKFDLQLLFT